MEYVFGFIEYIIDLLNINTVLPNIATFWQPYPRFQTPLPSLLSQFSKRTKTIK